MSTETRFNGWQCFKIIHGLRMYRSNVSHSPRFYCRSKGSSCQTCNPHSYPFMRTCVSIHLLSARTPVSQNATSETAFVSHLFVLRQKCQRFLHFENMRPLVSCRRHSASAGNQRIAAIAGQSA